MKKKTLGIIGGVGPLATMFIGEMIVRYTEADKDQDHINMVITNNTKIPDRTAYILGESDKNPTPVIISDAGRLKAAGADILIIPCNTAHSFYEEIARGAELPLINMVEETVRYVKDTGAKRVAILATTGTIKTKVYQNECEKNNLEPILVDDEVQEVVMSLIYDDIKAGKIADVEKWKKIERSLKDIECDSVILGCTELSIVKNELNLSRKYVDSLRVLAKRAILTCNYHLKE